MSRKNCCNQMMEILNLDCNEGESSFQCSNSVMYYNEKFDEYGMIIHDGGSSYIKIDFCPWCGKKLPDSKRYLWFNELEGLGFEDPSEEDIPLKYKSSLWWKEKE